MAGFIARQPNGLYCRFSTIVDCPTHINMTEEDYLNNMTERAFDVLLLKVNDMNRDGYEIT